MSQWFVAKYNCGKPDQVGHWSSALLVHCLTNCAQKPTEKKQRRKNWGQSTWEMFAVKGRFHITAGIRRDPFLKVTQENSLQLQRAVEMFLSPGLGALTVLRLTTSNSQWSLAKAMKSSLLIRTEQLKMSHNGNKEKAQQQLSPFITELPFISLAFFFFFWIGYLEFHNLVFEDTTSTYNELTLCALRCSSRLVTLPWAKWISMQNVNTMLN